MDAFDEVRRHAINPKCRAKNEFSHRLSPEPTAAFVAAADLASAKPPAQPGVGAQADGACSSAVASRRESGRWLSFFVRPLYWLTRLFRNRWFWLALLAIHCLAIAASQIPIALAMPWVLILPEPHLGLQEVIGCALSLRAHQR